MRRKKQIVEADETNWLISYADLMTLLCGFFIILTSFSKPDTEKFENLRKHTSNAMGGKYENPYEGIQKEIIFSIEDLGIYKSIEVKTGTDGLVVTAMDRTFFGSGEVRLEREANDFVKSIGDILAKQTMDFQIVVEGHTDDVPIRHPLYPSNWELSLRRASEVVRIFERLGVSRVNLLPQGLADTRPVIDTSGLSGEALESARAKNRRIVIRLVRKL
jgi:chemotaxis protein MotB